MQINVIDLNILIFLNHLHQMLKRGFSTQQNFIMCLLCKLNTGLIVEINHSNHILPRCIKIQLRHH